jgi:hypothetical protein
MPEHKMTKFKMKLLQLKKLTKKASIMEAMKNQMMSLLANRRRKNKISRKNSSSKIPLLLTKISSSKQTKNNFKRSTKSHKHVSLKISIFKLAIPPSLLLIDYNPRVDDNYQNLPAQVQVKNFNPNIYRKVGPMRVIFKNSLRKNKQKNP